MAECNSDLDGDVTCKLNNDDDIPCEKNSQIDIPCEVISQVDIPCELNMPVDILSESDIQVDVASESDIQVDVVSEPDIQVDVVSEPNTPIDTLSESNVSADILSESNVSADILSESNVSIDILSESNVSVDNLSELNTQVGDLSKSNVQVDILSEPNTQISVLPGQNIQADILSEPSTSTSIGSPFISHSSASNKVLSDTDLTTDETVKIDCSEAELTYTEFEASAGEYFFDTDHPALKENSDYRKLLHTVILLEATRAKGIRDLEKLRNCREKALEDPIGFLDKLQRGEDLEIPGPQKIPEIPEIDWTKYTVTPSEASFEKRQLTRQSTKIMCDILSPAKQDFDDKAKAANETKTFKASQSWSTEEQKRLEELLVKHPPEEVEIRRWEKIANELENRTPIQVASRVQKYFIKLMRAGMPIPGRQPNSCYNRKLRRQVVRQHPSTFFASYLPSLYLNYDESMSCSNSQSTSRAESPSDTTDDSDEEIGQDVRRTKEYQELLSMKKAIKDKKYSSGLAQHVGFKCGRCECLPIIGVRWHCVECKPSVDFCEDCVDCMHEFDSHTADHELEAIQHAIATSLDRDYTLFSGSNLNYLDPNYGF